ncbi:Trafficking protein particle complex subunit 11 [Pleurostoma richardsiae]|uniref:Trafficking protein particle complex subunit 11 n=1 Tax=Pleurostoma richardsiae TaxID=41990 RepID=A0AA38S649_9PEZI|nr:Trafficking protein particle complex subunit 11 [Pleurostoma richardsiae]
MDEYPPCSLDHSDPLLLVLGVSSTYAIESSLEPDLKEEAILLRSEPPPVDDVHAGPLLQYIQDADASDLPYNRRDAGRKYRFRVRTAGRSYLLPPRRVRLPENFEATDVPPVLHSPFSPLSPASHLYPDGLVDARWLRKHQELVPSAFMCFYTLTSDPTLASLDDNKIKTDISNLRSALLQSGYKSRLAVVIFSDQTTPSTEGVQERLDNIRRGSGLDAKLFFSVPTHGSIEEIERIADNTLVMVYAQVLEYYRDLGRHTRKKRGRGVAPQPTVPPTSGTSQTLSLPGWNVRYDFKSAVFAEYRMEMDTALRSFEQAYETLLSADVLDIIPSWSPRWNEARMLADIISVRVIRCLLWDGRYTAAVRRWQHHRDRIADFVDRRGHGTNNYGWEASEARWAVVMANLIDKAGIDEFDPATSILYLQPDRLLVAERLQPWEHLHHTGYWYRAAARHTYARRALAYSMPEDDRRSPSMSPASQVASKAFTYDTYMCPEPYEEYPVGHSGVNHSQMIIGYLTAAKEQFSYRGQRRLAAEITLECAKELASRRAWRDVVDLLRPLWNDMTFRAEGWFDIAEDLCWTLRVAAVQTCQADIIVPIDWELLNKKFTKRTNWHYDISRSLEGIESAKQDVKIIDDTGASFLSASFIFRHEEGKAGQTCAAQLSISSDAFSESAPVTFQSIEVSFEGSLRSITLSHVPSDVASRNTRVILKRITLDEITPDNIEVSQAEEETSPSVLRGTGDLTLAPGKTVVFEMGVPLREQGTAEAVLAKFTLENDSFSLEHLKMLRKPSMRGVWFLSPASSRPVARANPYSIRILPRPPKLEIEPLNLRDQYYTNEPVELRFKIFNEEDCDASAKFDIALYGEQPPNFRLRIGDQVETRALADGEESRLSGVSLGSIKSAESTPVTVTITPIERMSSYGLTLRVLYHLVTDPATPIIQTKELQLNVASPFEANYDLLPRVHPDPWPSLFDYEGIQDLSDSGNEIQQPHGLSQKWCLFTRYASFAAEDLVVKEVDIEIASAQRVRCHTSKRASLPVDGLQVSPKTIEEAEFDVVAQKMSLDDRSPASLDLSFIIKWTRLDDDSAIINRTVLPVPRMNIFGTEPRVLASVSYVDQPARLIFLTLNIENPSNHFLTFGLSMEPSDEFAFSGAKQVTLNVLPVSRRSVTYRLLPLVRGAWIKPLLVVRDKYFQKVLRIIPTDGMKLDKDGFLIWVPEEEEEVKTD